MDKENSKRTGSEESMPLNEVASHTETQKCSEDELNKAIQNSKEILISASSLDLIHRSTLTLTRTKLYGEKRSGLSKVSVMSVRAEDVLNINGDVSLISGFVDITTKFTGPGKPYHIGPFHRKDVLRLKRIIQGYVIALQKNIDLSPIPTPELITMLYELGDDDDHIR